MVADAGAQDSWNEVGGSTLIRWDEAKVVQGIFKGQVKSDSKFGQDKFAVEVNGEAQEFFAPSVLARLLRSPEIEPGKEIMIECTGKMVATNSGRAAKEFLVKVR